MGLVDFSVEVHYDEAMDAELLPLSADRTIFAIPDGCALLREDGTAVPVGKVYRFRDGRKAAM